jgi:hypothetical protein
MVQALLLPCIPDLYGGKCMADNEKITYSKNGKASYCRMSGYGKMKIGNWGVMAMIRNA